MAGERDELPLTNEAVIAAWSAEDGADFGDEGDFARRHLLNPAIFRLLGEVRGREVLDAGCGQGYLARLLARRGARVTGVEPADGLYRAAVAREKAEPLGVRYLQADLSRLQGYDRAFDAVVANMVLMDIPDHEPAMRACITALRPGGVFVFSLQHPCFEESSSAWPAQGYVAVREYLREHAIPQRVGACFHRPLSSYLNLLVREGCLLREVVEPGLPPELAALDPVHERNAHVPSFIIIAAVRAPE